jgi:hypothetical protein
MRGSTPDFNAIAHPTASLAQSPPIVGSVFQPFPNSAAPEETIDTKPALCQAEPGTFSQRRFHSDGSAFAAISIQK